MRIGILTQPLHNNYGGLLQNYALQQVLRGMGHEVETVDWDSGDVEPFKEWLWRRKQWLLHFFDKSVELPAYRLNQREFAIVSQHTNHFVEKNLSVSDLRATSDQDFGSITRKEQISALVVGSDQVWRPSYNPLLTSMFLHFTEGMDVKRIAYAASFGTSVWEFSPELTEECARLAKKFVLITVREKSGVDLCREHLGVDAAWVLDPTMLLKREGYEKLVLEEKEPKSAGTLFHYILDPSEEKKTLIERVAVKQGLQPFTIMPKCQAENRTKWDVKHRIEDCVFPTVTSWLRGFMDAKMVIVDSFHGAVFSIIFNKPFWVIGNKKRGNARFESLLGLFGLEDRMIAPGETVNWNKAIDWERVNDIQQKERERCVELLKKSLE